MRKIGIVTDSVSNLPQEIEEKQNIKVLPIRITFGAESFLDGIDLTPGDFYRMLEEYEEMPRIELPGSRDFVALFESMKKEGFEGVACILSCNLCQSFSQACEARDFVRPFPVMVIDSHTATMSQGFIVMEASRAAEEGLALTDILEKVWSMRQQVNFYGIPGMLHFLVRAGRLSKGKAYMQALMNKKQMITINKETGEFITAGKVRSRQDGIKFIKQKMEEALAAGGSLHAAVLHAAEAEEAQALYQELSTSFDCTELYLQELSPIVGCHLGPGVIGASYYVKNGQNQR